jgi:hypothetical protein
MNWLYTIKIKHLFEDETTKELIIKLCTSLEKQLLKIVNSDSINKILNNEDNIVELRIIIDNFNFLKKLADGTIKNEDWWQFSFDGEFEEWFNEYLEQLFDLGDNVCYLKHNELSSKFIWIG